ncbi:uncharacterized protein LOC135205489 [Macrobrachium nipponense]|uniref:uncharacterized protein LOC135205489 n=1 Tax=Macrobrachium nipponense TaxID=159736 RepID=UPI0030C8AE4B
MEIMNRLLHLLILTFGLAWSIKVGPVRLASMEEYITYSGGPSEKKSVIECPVALDGAETLKEVSWVFSDGGHPIGRYFWNKKSQGKAEGRLKDVVRLDRQDGAIELTELRYNLSGFYSCSATTDEGDSDEAAPWEVLIIDFNDKSPTAGLYAKGECGFESSFKISAFYPQPTLHSGLYSESLGGFFEEVASIDWYKQGFENGSYSYSHQNVLFKIKEDTPHDVYFLSSVGVSKKDGTYIPLFSVKSYIQIFEEQGCHPVKLDAYQKAEYSNGGARNCRKEIRQPASGQLKAVVSCMDGYEPAGDSDYESMELTCNTKIWEWGVLQ